MRERESHVVGGRQRDGGGAAVASLSETRLQGAQPRHGNLGQVWHARAQPADTVSGVLPRLLQRACEGGSPAGGDRDDLRQHGGSELQALFRSEGVNLQSQKRPLCLLISFFK